MCVLRADGRVANRDRGGKKMHFDGSGLIFLNLNTTSANAISVFISLRPL